MAPSRSGADETGGQDDEERLDSWKEIAAYLKRDVSTVQRWERLEAMPVHRHKHDKLWSVYAFRTELDAWWSNRSSRARPAARDSRFTLPIYTAGATAVAIVAALIIGADRPGIGRTAARDPAARQEYLVGRYYLWRFDEDHLKRAIDHFERASHIDPTDAAPLAALSNAWWARGMFGPIGLRAADVPARRAAEAALRLNSRLPATYVAQGDIKRLFDQDLVGAEKMFRRALDLDANSLEAHHSYALLLMALGRFTEALAHIGRAAELEPAAPAIQASFGRILYRAGRFQEALQRTQRAMELEPTVRSHYDRLGDIYEQLGQYDRAIEAYDRRGDHGPVYQARRARIMARLGRHDEARVLLGAISTGSSHAPVMVAAAYAALGDKERASALLASQIERRDPGPGYFPVDPLFASLHSTPEWRELLRRVGATTR